MLARPGREREALALLALLNSAMIVYLYNLFSTNNHIVLRDLERVPTPERGSLDTATLARLVHTALDRRSGFESCANAYEAEVTDGTTVTVDASIVLARSQLRTLTGGDLVRRGEISVRGQDSTISAILRRGDLHFAGTLPAEPYVRLFARRQDRRLSDVIDEIEVPDVDAAANFARLLTEADAEAQALLQRFLDAERAIDEFVFDWYGLRESWRSPVWDGLPWAR